MAKFSVSDYQVVGPHVRLKLESDCLFDYNRIKSLVFFVYNYTLEDAMQDYPMGSVVAEGKLTMVEENDKKWYFIYNEDSGETREQTQQRWIDEATKYGIDLTDWWQTKPRFLSQLNPDGIKTAHSFYKSQKELPDGYAEYAECMQLFEQIEQSNNSFFITGKAGTGKSTFIHYLTQKSNKNMLLFAFTGVAALNIGGQTLHSFFSFPLKPLAPNDADIKTFLPNDHKREIIIAANTIIIDEVSMLRADILEAIDTSLRKNGGDPQLPFGGKQMIFVGDLYQLPPVVDNEDEVENILFTQYFDNELFFNAHAFKSLKVKNFEFSKIHRQNDPAFIALLNKIRIGEITEIELRELNENCAKSPLADESITLVTTNSQAEERNMNKLLQLPSAPKIYTAKIINDFKANKMPTKKELELRIGARVMLIKNDMNKRWVNGSLGEVTQLKDDSIVVKLDAGEAYEVKRESWEDRVYRWDKEKKAILSQVVASFEQIPVKLAWAITIHKSQGLTFDKVNIDLGRGAFLNGQLYTALSRCKRAENLHLSKNITMHDVKVDGRVATFLYERG